MASTEQKQDTMQFALDELEKVREKMEYTLGRVETAVTQYPELTMLTHNAEDDLREAIDNVPWIEDAIYRLAGVENPGGDPSEPGHPDNPRSHY